MMKLLLLVVMLSLQSGLLEGITVPTTEFTYEEYADYYISWEPVYHNMENITVPNITVYRQMEDREHDSVIVLCMFDRMRYSWQMQFFELSVESELNYTKENLKCTLDGEMCVFMVTVSPPASFTCVHEIHSNGEVKNLSSHTYSYKRSVLDHHKEGVSLFYICFSSFIAVGLVIMTAAVIVTTIRSKAKDSINHTTTVTDNDYMDA
ncbi:uncharacterized protein LOC125279951 [Megalobrama amblycephala]|uniref:uncharacterized protein LOC125279951 n=1 Tax=Megalobrama amblycephala TaxID=75352 RepID=UPI002013F21D|nr:uncharacterized protein LOC125279951 [Megalobrama amblycephala]XP_048066138.1 uncharacterized protein LOC125279951 [Megalobrama amblycephala]